MGDNYTVLEATSAVSVSNYRTASEVINGVIIRAAYRGYGLSGNIITDSLFETHYSGFYGKNPVGVYFTTNAITEEEVEEEVLYFYNLIKKKDIKFPIYVESNYSSSIDKSGRADKLDRETRTHLVKVFCTKFKQLGYRAGIITTDYFLNFNLNILEFDSDISIVFNDLETPLYYTNYDGIKTTNAGKVIGINSNVKLYNFVHDVAGWREGELINISTLNVEIEYDSIVYTGEYLYPKITIEDLIENRDYTCEYSTNRNAGTGNVLVRGVNNYTGVVSKTFTILKKNIVTEDISFYPTEYIYSGHSCLPTVFIPGLKEGSDFTVTYGQNINVGIGSLKITGYGNYEGFVNSTFNIVPKNIDLVDGYVTPSMYAYKGIPLEPVVYLDELVQGQDFTISYEDNINPGIGKAIATGIGNYTGTKTFEFEIKVRDIALLDIQLEYESIVYNRKENRPAVTIEDLEEYRDYDVDYLNNVNVGTATCRIRGIGDFTGTTRKTFTIKKKDIAELAITMDKESYPYTGKEIKPRLSIETGLVENIDYKTTYTDNINPGTATVKLSAKNNYTGGVTLTYPIEYVNVNDCEAKYGKRSDKTVYWIGLDGPFQLYSDNVLLTENTDYVINDKTSVTGEDYTQVTIKVTGVGGIVGDATFIFKVIAEEPPAPIPPGPDVPVDDRPDDGTYNFGDIDEHDETAVGNYDFGDIDEGYSDDNVVIDNADYDFNKFCYDEEDEGRDDIRFAPGTEYILQDAKFYSGYSAKLPFDIRSGSYLIYKQESANNRIRVTKSSRAINNPVRADGWVDKQDILALIEFYPGIYVKVSGNFIYQYANGTGYKVQIEEGQTMYIARKMDQSYQYRYGLSTSETTQIIGYASEDQLSRIIEE